MIHPAQKMREQISYVFQTFQKLDFDFQILQIPDPIKSVFGSWDVFVCFVVQQITDLFTILKMFHKLVLLLCISFSYEPSRQYGISPFLKTILK